MSGRGGNGRGAAAQRPLVSKPARSAPQSTGQPSLAACAGALLSPRATHRYVNGDEQEENLLDQALYDGEEEDEEGMGIGAGSASKMQPLEHPAPPSPVVLAPRTNFSMGFTQLQVRAERDGEDKSELKALLNSAKVKKWSTICLDCLAFVDHDDYEEDTVPTALWQCAGMYHTGQCVDQVVANLVSMPKSDTKLFAQLAMQLVSACASPEAARLIPAQQHQLGSNAVIAGKHLSMYDWACTRFAELREASDAEATSRAQELAALELEVQQAKALDQQRLLSRRAELPNLSQLGKKRAHDGVYVRSAGERFEGAADDEGDDGLAQLQGRPKGVAPELLSHLRPKGTAGAGGNTRVVDEDDIRFWQDNIAYMQSAFYQWGMFIDIWQLAISEKVPARRRMWAVQALAEAEKSGILEYEPGGDALDEIKQARNCDPPQSHLELTVGRPCDGGQLQQPRRSAGPVGDDGAAGAVARETDA